jgi:LacI family transcriptional regulator
LLASARAPIDGAGPREREVGVPQNLVVRLYADVVHAYSRGILRGIADYSKLHGGWDFNFNPRIDPDFTETFARDQVRGVIIQVRTVEQSRKLLDSGVPAVNISNVLSPPAPLPSVYPDNDAVGRMAASYFLERGFVNFAFCCGSSGRYAQERRESFAQELKVAGHECAFLDGSNSADAADGTQPLANLARPLAVFCCGDLCAREIIHQATGASLQVPDQIAVLGVDNDEIHCELAGVQLSSIRLNTEQIGYEAAALLARLIDGQAPPNDPIRVPPIEVITRRSTDVLALADTEVAAAVRFIRDRGGREINVEDLLSQTRLSRRSLEMRFRKALGRSPYQEIRRVQIERAKLLLTRTDRPMREIADACGFRETRQLSVAFHERIGVTPRQYRRRAQRESEVHATHAPTETSD